MISEVHKLRDKSFNRVISSGIFEPAVKNVGTVQWLKKHGLWISATD